MMLMQSPRSKLWLTRVVAYTVMLYGVSLLALALSRQLHAHPGHYLNIFLITVPQVIGLGFVYLGNLLRRRKYTAWLAALILFGVSLGLELGRSSMRIDFDDHLWLTRVLLPLCILILLWVTRDQFRVRSDIRSFTDAIRLSLVVLLIAFVYGMVGFTILDRHDFHREISRSTAAHLTVDQFGLTTNHPVAHTRRARLFLDSLSVVSVSAVAYAAISLFSPIRMRLTNQTLQREHAERLLKEYPSDIDDFFKLWPHDKLYFFDPSQEAGLAYHVSRGVALVAGDPFGDPKRFNSLLRSFQEYCFVNDWAPAFIHVGDRHTLLYERNDFQLQKIGEEAVLSLASWPETQTGKRGKHFREIRNRFTRLGYTFEIVQAPHDQAILSRLRQVSDEWLTKPGRAERGFLLGYHSDTYLQQTALALVRDDKGLIQGFMNLVPTFEPNTLNYDLLRCSENAPGNCNDFLLMCTLDQLAEQGIKTFNLGLSPLAGLDDEDTSEDKTLVDNTLRFLYSNGDRLYSFSGLRRFKDKYNPEWQDRFIAYQGGAATFTRILRALNRAMRVKTPNSK